MISKSICCFIIIFTVVILDACTSRYISGDCSLRYTIKVEEYFSIDKELLMKTLSSSFKQNNDSPYLLEIIILKYSSGKEVFSYDKENKMVTETVLYDANLEALLKVKKNNELLEFFILTASGKDETELFNNFRSEIRKAVNKLCD